MIGLCLKTGRVKVLVVTVALVVLIAFTDWSVGRSMSLGILYILPMVLGAVVLAPWEIGVLAILCSLLRSTFDTPGSHAEVMLRFAFATLAYFTSGLFVTALVRNRELVVEHLATIEKEQALRREAEEQLSVLAESSPAAILTLDNRGVVLAANHAANSLFGIPEGQVLLGRGIERYLPVLSDALRLETGPDVFRTAAQCQGQRDNGELFLANTWFSSYVTSQGVRLAAIVVDSSEEMREQEEQNLHHLMNYNRIAAAAVSHEVRNLCSSISLLSSNLAEKHDLAGDQDCQGLLALVLGLEKMASFELHSRVHETFEAISLKAVLDNLRIMIEPDWQDANGVVRWNLPEKCPAVVADAHGLLQAFLNLTKNSLRAVQEVSSRELAVGVSVLDKQVLVRFEDTGPGIGSPERLFQPFQSGADGAGLGLYVSRAIMRSYGGDLRFESTPQGTCFVVELQIA
ncbi:MAG: PAS domain-containing sensor histidine kinase [Acidobacteriia bacterium]|nr:PAS domain-containing sensor histidine kinase [Terriglobia bacterium]